MRITTKAKADYVLASPWIILYAPLYCSCQPLRLISFIYMPDVWVILFVGQKSFMHLQRVNIHWSNQMDNRTWNSVIG